MKKSKEIMDDFIFNLRSNTYKIKRVKYPDDMEDNLPDDYIEKRLIEFNELLDSKLIDESLKTNKESFKLEYLPKHKRKD